MQAVVSVVIPLLGVHRKYFVVMFAGVFLTFNMVTIVCTILTAILNFPYNICCLSHCPIACLMESLQYIPFNGSLQEMFGHTASLPEENNSNHSVLKFEAYLKCISVGIRSPGLC